MSVYFLNTLGDLGDPALCVLDHIPPGLGAAYSRLAKGRPMGGDFPAQAGISMTEGHEGIRLASLVGHTQNFIVASRALQTVIREAYDATPFQDRIEILPVSIIDHRGRVRSDEYALVNPLGTFDVLDHERSEVEYFEGYVIGVDKYVLDAEKVAAAPPLFRLQEKPSRYLVQESLARAIEQAALTNVILEQVEQTP
jgi:hypothetical protein